MVDRCVCFLLLAQPAKIPAVLIADIEPVPKGRASEVARANDEEQRKRITAGYVTIANDGLVLVVSPRHFERNEYARGLAMVGSLQDIGTTDLATLEDLEPTGRAAITGALIRSGLLGRGRSLDRVPFRVTPMLNVGIRGQEDLGRIAAVPCLPTLTAPVVSPPKATLKPKKEPGSASSAPGSGSLHLDFSASATDEQKRALLRLLSRETDRRAQADRTKFVETMRTAAERLARSLPEGKAMLQGDFAVGTLDPKVRDYILANPEGSRHRAAILSGTLYVRGLELELSFLTGPESWTTVSLSALIRY